MSEKSNTTLESSGFEEGDIREFVGINSVYYLSHFDQLIGKPGYSWTFNWAAALMGPVWMASRQLWNLFWIFLFLELLAFVQIARGIWADLGIEQFERGQRLARNAALRLEEAQAAANSGAANAGNLMDSAQSLERAAEAAMGIAQMQADTAPWLVAGGVLFLLAVKVLAGSYGNWALFKRFTRWQTDRSIGAGVNRAHVISVFFFILVLAGLTIYRFTANSIPTWLESVPAKRSWRLDFSKKVDEFFEWFTVVGENFFSSITSVIRSLLDAMDVILVDTPWPVVMIVIILLALQLAGPRVAIFTTACLAYLGVFGFWEKSMETVALLGTAAFICIVIGIPLGILCAKKPRIYALVRPILDLMQTMPSFVYLIPVIAFFGIGKAPGVVATVVFGMPPVVRLTALGLSGVPESVREAAHAFGVSKMFLLFRIDLPLALPSIMTGINQTILMCLSMVVIASLIGAKGLGEDVLHALTYADEGQGILAGMAILFCAMILDRIVQGRRARNLA